MKKSRKEITYRMGENLDYKSRKDYYFEYRRIQNPKHWEGK